MYMYKDDFRDPVIRISNITSYLANKMIFSWVIKREFTFVNANNQHGWLLFINMTWV